MQIRGLKLRFESCGLPGWSPAKRTWPAHHGQRKNTPPHSIYALSATIASSLFLKIASRTGGETISGTETLPRHFYSREIERNRHLLILRTLNLKSPPMACGLIWTSRLRVGAI